MKIRVLFKRTMDGEWWWWCTVAPVGVAVASGVGGVGGVGRLSGMVDVVLDSVQSSTLTGTIDDHAAATATPVTVVSGWCQLLLPQCVGAAVWVQLVRFFGLKQIAGGIGPCSTHSTCPTPVLSLLGAGSVGGETTGGTITAGEGGQGGR